MRHIIFILVLSVILVPLVAVQQGMSESELMQPVQAAISQTSESCQKAVDWLREEAR